MSPRTPQRAAQRVPGAWLVVSTALLMVAGAVIAIRLVQRDRSSGGVAAADSLATMDPQQALGRGVELGRHGRHSDSLPYFRRAAEAGGWTAHWNYAAAMNNATFEVWSRHGVLAPASRSSIERLALMREALDEVRVAERRAPDRRTVAVLELVRGRTLMLWGFPLDALEVYRGALAIDSTSATTRRMIAECEASLRGGAPTAP